MINKIHGKSLSHPPKFISLKDNPQAYSSWKSSYLSLGILNDTLLWDALLNGGTFTVINTLYPLYTPSQNNLK